MKSPYLLNLIAFVILGLPSSGFTQSATDPAFSPEVADAVARSKAQKHSSDTSGAVSDSGASGMYDQLFDTLFSYLNKPETATKLAKFQRNYYEALIKEGFTKDEAMKIIVSSTNPLLGSK